LYVIYIPANEWKLGVMSLQCRCFQRSKEGGGMENRSRLWKQLTIHWKKPQEI